MHRLYIYVNYVSIVSNPFFKSILAVYLADNRTYTEYYCIIAAQIARVAQPMPSK